MSRSFSIGDGQTEQTLPPPPFYFRLAGALARRAAAFSVYSASKAAVRNVARSWALDLKDTGIRVNVISPGSTRAPALVALAGNEKAQQSNLLDFLASRIPPGRVGEPEEIAKAALFLASDSKGLDAVPGAASPSTASRSRPKGSRRSTRRRLKQGPIERTAERNEKCRLADGAATTVEALCREAGCGSERLAAIVTTSKPHGGSWRTIRPA